MMDRTPEQTRADLIHLIRANTALEHPEVLLEVLAAEGWSLHRLDDYEHGVPDGVTFDEANPPGKDGLILLVDSRPWTPHTMKGIYALVPVESGEAERAAKENP